MSVPVFEVLERLRGAADGGDTWDTCVSIAQDLGADALNIVAFQGQSFAPVWMRVSTQQLGGLAEYVAEDYFSVDPILVPRAAGTMKDVDHVSLHALLARPDLTAKELACYKHLLAHGQSEYLTFRLRRIEDDLETLVVFACHGEGVDRLRALGAEHLSLIANLLALHVTPPTPSRPNGKVPLLYDFLTEREREVLSAMAQGCQNDEIAHRLGVSEVTVRKHTTSARQKMQATTRSQALALALVRGLVTL